MSGGRERHRWGRQRTRHAVAGRACGALLVLMLLVAGCGGSGRAAPGESGPSAPGRAGAGATTSAGGSPGTSSEVGRSGGQPLPDGHAPDRRFAVGTQTVTLTRTPDRVLDVTVWYPARSGGRDVVAAAGRFPVILFSHGLNGLPGDYAPLLRRWASAGVVVVAPAYPNTKRGTGRLEVFDVIEQPADASFVLSRVLAGHLLHAAVDSGRVAAAGHSAGGITTVGLFTSARDVRLVAGVVLAGSSLGVGAAFTGPPAYLLFVHGDVDPLVPYSGGQQAYEADPWAKGFLSLPGQGHSEPYLNSGTAAYAVVATTTTDFWRFALYGDRAAGRRLAGDARAGARTGVPATLVSTLPN